MTLPTQHVVTTESRDVGFPTRNVEPRSRWRRLIPTSPPLLPPRDNTTLQSPLTGPPTPQPHIPLPEDMLLVRKAPLATGLWIVGAHGGAGETTFASLDPSWRATERAWPELPWGAVAPCVVIARTHARGLLAAQAAVTQWAASGAGESAKLLGLVFVPDAPKKLPETLRDLSRVVGSGAPRSWTLPWVEAWRAEDPTAENTPRSVINLVSHLRSLAEVAPATSASSPNQIGEQP